MNKIDKFEILFGKPKFGWIAILIQKNGDINKLDEDISVLVNCKNKLEKLKLIIPEFEHKI